MRSYLELVKALHIQTPHKVSGRRVKEIVNCQLVLDCPRDMFVRFKHRNMDYAYFAGMLAWYLRARIGKLDGIELYHPSWSRIQEPDINSNYGIYIWDEDQWERAVISRLTKDPTSRQAVIIFNKAIINTSDTNDHICTTSLQFLIRNQELMLITTMRSNDFWNGTCYDVPFFMLLQGLTHAMLRYNFRDLRLGHYFHNVGSMHAYEENWNDLSKIIREPATENEGMYWFDHHPVVGRDQAWELVTRFGRAEEQLRAYQTIPGGGSPIFNWLFQPLAKKWIPHTLEKEVQVVSTPSLSQDGVFCKE